MELRFCMFCCLLNLPPFSHFPDTRFSSAQARTPDTCGKCHMGPDHPQIEIYNESKHGILYRAKLHEMNLKSKKWVVGVDYTAAPTCATIARALLVARAAVRRRGRRPAAVVPWRTVVEACGALGAADAGRQPRQWRTSASPACRCRHEVHPQVHVAR